ncbi:MAG: GNAT family N-acetyltransferase [Sphingomonadales bacterium 32-68-7]|nr:MAG: GNAT family N-acetyltransferase [Sphingomonadales bacterium 12-68-11]OYX09938.1 MAG: GNAT family N-acetyltransferase [Sphingomonadales bacterium 32-68-7]
MTHLRPATAADAEALARLGRDSFLASFGHLYQPDDLAAFLEQVHSVPAVAEEIADPTLTHRLASDTPGGALTGYVKLRQPTKFAEDTAAASPIELGQLYTDPARTGQGIGAALMEWAISESRARGCDAMLLSVWSENFGAQRFYQRYGFRKIADIGFWVGEQRDDEFLYELRL